MPQPLRVYRIISLHGHDRVNSCGCSNHVCIPERTRRAADRQHTRDGNTSVRVLLWDLRPAALRWMRGLHLFCVCPSACLLLQLVRRLERFFVQPLRPSAVCRVRSRAQLLDRSR